MKFEVSDGMVKNLLCVFLGLGSCTYACMLVSYILWFMGQLP